MYLTDNVLSTAADVVAATIAAMDAPTPGNAYNVSGGSEISLRDAIHISENSSDGISR